jgi:hypothetical protein
MPYSATRRTAGVRFSADGRETPPLQRYVDIHREK